MNTAEAYRLVVRHLFSLTPEELREAVLNGWWTSADEQSLMIALYYLAPQR